MSKQQKPKISLELPKKNLVNVSSVFHRLGHKGKEKIPKAQSIVDKKALEVVVDHQMTDSVSAKLQLVRQKAAQIMDSKKKQEPVLADRPQLTVIKTVRPVRRSSSSDSSSSSSASSSSSSSPRRKGKKRNVRKRAPSSSSEERKVVKKHHKKSDKKAHKKARELTKTLVKRAISPSYSRRRESESPPKKVIKVRKEKAYRESREVMREVERDRELYEREKAKARERERVRSPSPKRRSRSPVPVRGVYRSRERSDDRSPYRRSERERKEREYDIARERERAEALARCQERQRERERLKKLEEMERTRERRPRSRSFSRERVIRERETYERRPYEEIPVRRSPREYRRDESPYERPRHYEEERRPEYREEYHNKHERYEERRGYEREADWDKPSTSTKEIYPKPPYRREYEGGAKDWQKEPPIEHYKPGYPTEQKHWDETRPTTHTPMIKREWTGGPPTYRSPRPRLERPEIPGYRPRIPYQGHRAPFRPRNPGGFNPRHSFHGNSSYFPRVRAPYQPRQPMQIVQPVVTAPVEIIKPPRHEKDEDNLSEISDEADDILAKPEGMFGRQLRARHRQFPATEQKPPVEEVPAVDDIKSHANKTLKEEMQLDFEEISDGELDEENKIKSLGDALGVDWSSIVEESKKKIKDESQTSNAKEKWQAHRILLEVGISTQMAGEEFAAHIIKDSYEKVKQEVTAQILMSAHKTATGFDGKPIKDEPTEEDTKPDIEAKVREILPYTDVDLFEKRFAFMQNGFKERLEQRRNLVVNAIGTCSRALSARQDLKIRKKLCGLPEEEMVRDILPIVSEEEDVKPQSSIELAFQMFKKATERVC